MSFIDIVTNSIYFYSCMQLKTRQKLGRKEFLKKRTMMRLSLPEILGLTMQEIPMTAKEETKGSLIILYPNLQIFE